ncbi:unnamed protein product, partial [Ectocarpus fasciculatus]
MDQHQHYLIGGRSSAITCTAIPALKWPPRRNASLVLPGYPGSCNSSSSNSRGRVEPASFPSASGLLQCTVLRASPPVGAYARGVGERQRSRCSSRVNEGMMSRSAGGGRQPTTTTLSPAQESAFADAATTSRSSTTA